MEILLWCDSYNESPSVGIVSYRNSTPIGYVASGTRNIYSIGLRFLHGGVPRLLGSTNATLIVLPAGIGYYITR